MLERFGAYLASKPKRAVQIVLALAIALIVTLAGMFIIAFDLGEISDESSDPPYPSEVTPLSLVDDGVMRMKEFNLTIGESGLNYSEFRCGWGYRTAGASVLSSLIAGQLVSDENQADLNKNVSSTVQTYFGTTTPWYDAPNMTLRFSIHDVTGDGAFGTQDFIVIDDAPRTEGIVYSWALAYVYGVSLAVEYSYAFQDGVFYSWRSNEFPTEGVWWDF
ncbi:MAG: hypothetical protein IH631_06250 [Candidatus Thorarchaeota archaeon]|nr:hypothetical protein [Candidatus Thorarchaeota archaeon]